MKCPECAKKGKDSEMRETGFTRDEQDEEKTITLYVCEDSKCRYGSPKR